MLPRRDAAIGGEDPIPDCSRGDTKPCAAGQRCAVLIRRAPDATDFTIAEGCVAAGATRGLGDPCAPFGGLDQPYRVPGLTDEVHVDQCGDGLFCASSVAVRGLNTCQPACAAQSVSGYDAPCEGAGEYCSGTGAFQQVCRKSDGCNPADPTSCGAGRGCYLRVGDDGMSVLSVCFPAPDMPVADGETCIDAMTGTYYINACNPGSSCWGPVRRPPTAWAIADYLCRRACDPGAGSGTDAGDDDAGVGGSSCRGGQECVDFSESGLDISNVHGDFGACE